MSINANVFISKEHGYIGDNIVQVSSSEKDLGVIVESTIDWW